jgi:glycosyltransferase involved in cell wall biosynthesis
MKILCVIPSYWPTFAHGGPIFSVHNLNKALAKKGVDLTVYTTNAGLSDKVPLNQEVNIDGVKVTYFSFTKLLEFLGTIGWQFSRPITRALKKNLPTFDLVYIVNIWSYPALAASYYSRLYGLPYIVVPSGMLYPNTLSKKAWKKILYYSLLVKRDLFSASAIHYTAADEAEKTHAFLSLENQPIIVPNGVDLSEFSNLPDQEKLKLRYPHLRGKKIILFLGRIHWIKGIDILLKAYALLAQNRDDLHLLLVGDGDRRYGNKVKKWLKEYGLDFTDSESDAKSQKENAQVTFSGAMIGRQKLEAYAGSDIFVLSSYSENFGMAVVEAMACSLPVVISNKVGIYKEVEQKKAGIVVDADVNSLYQGMKLLLENPGLKKELASNARKLVQDCYDIEKVADKMIEVYRQTILRSKK